MQLLTPVETPTCPWQITYSDRLLLLGSCFSDNMARKLSQYFFQVTANPFGTLYNPASIAHHIPLPLPDRTPATPNNPTNHTPTPPFPGFADADTVFITFGTAWVYADNALLKPTVSRRSADGQPTVSADVFGMKGCPRTDLINAVVDNCQKRPATDFTRFRLTVSEITALWLPLLQQYPDKHFIFTVSPIRHLKDGLHANQLSKAILLQAIDLLVNAAPDNTAYFPAYEILLDELRDYRFYAADMMHPSDTAIDYIWEKFALTYLQDPETQHNMRLLHQLYLDRQHRPLKPDSNEYQQFLIHLHNSELALSQQFPWIMQTPHDSTL